MPDRSTITARIRHEAKTLVEKMFKLQVDLIPFYQMASQDPKLLVLVEKFQDVKPPRFPTIFATLANAFACEQLSLTVGLGLLSRLASVTTENVLLRGLAPLDVSQAMTWAPATGSQNSSWTMAVLLG